MKSVTVSYAHSLVPIAALQEHITGATTRNSAHTTRFIIHDMGAHTAFLLILHMILRYAIRYIAISRTAKKALNPEALVLDWHWRI